jgi:ligand-binding sensor domain-containing protein
MFTRLGARDGLASNSVYSLQQDAKGFIWVGTSNGLQRYDGTRFLLFQHQLNDSNSLPNNIVQQVLLDKNNRLWVRCAFNKLGYIDLANLRYHPVQALVADEHLDKGRGHLYVDQAGHILLFLFNRAVLTYDERIKTFMPGSLPFQLPPGWQPIAFFQDSDANYWLGSDSGLVKYNPRRRTLSYRGHNTDNDPVIGFYANYTNLGFPYLDHSGRFWVMYWPMSGVPASYLSVDVHTGKGKSWNASIGRILKGRYNEMSQIAEQGDGTIWFTGINMLAMLRPAGSEFEMVEPNAHGEFSVYYDVVQSWLQDRERNIWLATDRGLYFFNPEAQRMHAISNRMPGSDSVYTGEVTAVRQLRNGDIMVSSWGDGIFAYDSNFNPVRRWYVDQAKKYPVEEHQSWCILERPNGDIWHGHQHGALFISHWGSRTTEKLDLPVFGHSTIRQIVADTTGNVWLGTHSGRLIRWDARLNRFTLMDTLSSTIQRLYVDRKGNIWACTQLEGVFRIRVEDGAILNRYSNTGPEGRKLSGVGATDIVQYSDSLYIVATYNLDIINTATNRIRSDTGVNGALFSGATNIIQDRRGYLWITNSEGLNNLNFRKQLGTTFFETDGVGANAFNLGSASELKDGRIAIGTAHDLLVFQPADIKSSDTPPNDVVFTGIWMQNRSLSVDSVEKLHRLELPYGQNSVRIAFSTLAYQNISGIVYQLEGIDKDWIDSRSNDAVYNYLPPGKYTFRVRGVNAENLVSLHTNELSIIVPGPFWRSWWFLCLVLLTGAGVLYLLDRQRMQRKEVVEKMRSDISGNLHEEVNKALQNINVLSEIARIKADKDPEQSVNYINEIHHKSHNMIIAMDDMLWTIDPTNDNMARAIDRMQEFADALMHRHGVHIRLQAEKGLEALHPAMKIRYELLLIYKLMLRLLVEESNAPDTLVQLDQNRGLLQLNIYSGGIKIDPRSSRSIRLLEEAKSRAAVVRGTLDWQSDEKGTAILFICPSTF